MCSAPLTLEDGQQIACRKCWQCLERRIDDWVGRNIAESRFAKGAHSMTLTYGPDEHGNEDHPRAKWLTYSDVQKFLKQLRFDGFPVRYFVAGEYGSRNGRAHWHIITYWQDRVPDFRPEDMRNSFFRWPAWKHGFTFVDDIHQHSVRYACKYVQKDSGEEGQGALRMSKKPLLGAEYLREKARQLVEQRLAPRDPWYQFPDVMRTDKSGRRRPVRFRLANAALDYFMNEYVRQWAEAYPGVLSPYTEFFEEWLDKQARPKVEAIRAEAEWGARHKAAERRYTEPFHDIDDWQNTFEKERGLGTPEQQEFEDYCKWRREIARQDDHDARARAQGYISGSYLKAAIAATHGQVAATGD